MKTFLVRLHMAWCCLTAPRALLFLPKPSRGRTELTVFRAGAHIGPSGYAAVGTYAGHLENAARLLAEEKLLHELVNECQRVDALEAEIAAILRA